jgi:hypothetical protein
MRLVWTIIGILILFHAYLYVRYQQIDPCAAALTKVAREQPEAVERVNTLIANRDLKAIGMCYWVAVAGAPEPPPG